MRRVPIVTYHRKGIFKTKILVKMILFCKIIKGITGCCKKCYILSPVPHKCVRILKSFVKNVQSNWLAEILMDSSLKNSLIFTVICHKNFLPIWHFNVVDPIYPPMPLMSPSLDFFYQSLYKSNWLNIFCTNFQICYAFLR